MTELFLVNMIHRGGNYGGDTKEGDWVCFEATHSLASATDMAKSLREGGNEVVVQSVLLAHNGRVQL